MELSIESKLYGPYNQTNGSPYFMLTIGRKEDLRKYADKVGFNHSEKVKKLNSVLNLRPDGTMVMRQPGNRSKINSKLAWN